MANLWLGYLDSNQEQKNQNLPCCQLHHTPPVPGGPGPTVYFSVPERPSEEVGRSVTESLTPGRPSATPGVDEKIDGTVGEEEGWAMSPEDVISAGTNVGAVTLKVADLDAMTAFYRDGVGLAVLSHKGDRVILGSGTPSVVLEHSPLLKHAPEGAAGLFHTALLFETQAALAAALHSVATKYPRAFTGSADHLVSEALYFDDPEGNGVELYWDRPRSTWRWDGSRVTMDTKYLDPNVFLHTHLSDVASAQVLSPTTVGHVHLKVGDIPSARKFYSDILGFEVTAEFGSQALFVAAGGYHHHLGMNTWQSRGARDRSPALGLGEVAIQLPTPDDLGALRERLAAGQISTRYDGRTLTFDDPWRNEIAVAVAESGT